MVEADLLGVKMGRFHAAVICLLLVACQSVPTNPGPSPLPGASAKPSASHASVMPLPSSLSSAVLPTPATLPTPVPSMTEDPLSSIPFLPPEARPIPPPEPPLLSSSLTVLAGSDVPGFLDGVGELAKFNSPRSLALDNQGNILIADTGNHAIRKISPEGEVTTLAGTGQAGNADGSVHQAQFTSPVDLVINNQGQIFILDDIYIKGHSQRIRKIDNKNNVSTLKFDKPDFFNTPLLTLAIQKKSNDIYISGYDSIFRIQQEHQVSQTANSDSFSFENSGLKVGSERFKIPNISSLLIDSRGYMFISDAARKIIWKMNPEGRFSSLSGGAHFHLLGVYLDACNDFAGFYILYNMDIDEKGNIYIADNLLIRKVSPDGCVSTLKIQNKSESQSQSILKPIDLTLDKAQNLLYILSENKVYKLDLNARAPSG